MAPISSADKASSAPSWNIVALDNLGQKSQPVHIRHFDIECDDIRPGLAYQPARRGGVLGRTHHFEMARAFENLREEAAHQGRIVYGQNADIVCHGINSGCAGGSSSKYPVVE
jgi:hypothetical protein